MPPSATSNLPRRSATAPVNAPRTWPNSSLSISSSGIAAQLTSTNVAVAPAAQRVDRPRDQLLAGAVLAVDQHAAVGRRRHRDLLAQLAHRVALADHRLVPVDAGAQRAVLRLEAALPQRVADDEHGLLERQRLLDEVEGAQLDRADRRLDVAVAGDQHDLRVDLPLAQAGERRQAVHAGQPDVEHDQIDGAARERDRGSPRRSTRPRRCSPRRAARRSARSARPARRRRSGSLVSSAVNHEGTKATRNVRLSSCSSCLRGLQAFVFSTATRL